MEEVDWLKARLESLESAILECSSGADRGAQPPLPPGAPLGVPAAPEQDHPSRPDQDAVPGPETTDTLEQALPAAHHMDIDGPASSGATPAEPALLHSQRSTEQRRQPRPELPAVAAAQEALSGTARAAVAVATAGGEAPFSQGESQAGGVPEDTRAEARHSDRASSGYRAASKSTGQSQSSTEVSGRLPIMVDEEGSAVDTSKDSDEAFTEGSASEASENSEQEAESDLSSEESSLLE